MGKRHKAHKVSEAPVMAQPAVEPPPKVEALAAPPSPSKPGKGKGKPKPKLGKRPA